MWSINARLGKASPAELARACEAIAAELAARPAPESGLAALEVAESVSRAIDLAEAAMAVLVAKVDVSGAHGEHGFPSAVSWLRERTGMRHGRAAERITLARQLPRLERVRKLLSGGELSLGYASAVCAAVPRLDDEDAVVAEEILLGLVEEGCAVGQVAKAGERITDLVAERLGRESEPGDGNVGSLGRGWAGRSRWMVVRGSRAGALRSTPPRWTRSSGPSPSPGPRVMTVTSLNGPRMPCSRCSPGAIAVPGSL